MNLKSALTFAPWFFHTLRFNFHYLPFRQAVKLPFILSKVRFVALKGEVCIEGPIKKGMILIGPSNTSLFPKERVRLDLHGRLVFRGSCKISSGSAISTRKDSLLIFGDHSLVSDRCKIICSDRMEFGHYFMLAWEVTLCDNDFHSLKKVSNGEKTIPFAPISIGEGCWIGQKAVILKGVNLPSHVTIQADSLVTHRVKCQEYSVIGGNPAHVLSEGKYYWDFLDDKPDYSVRKTDSNH